MRVAQHRYTRVSIYHPSVVCFVGVNIQFCLKLMVSRAMYSPRKHPDPFSYHSCICMLYTHYLLTLSYLSNAMTCQCSKAQFRQASFHISELNHSDYQDCHIKLASPCQHWYHHGNILSLSIPTVLK